MGKDISLKDTKEQLAKALAKTGNYIGLVFFLLLGIVYGFVILRINSLNSAEVSPEAIAAQVKSSLSPRIDEETVQKLQSLQDNSVNVQTLFEEARTNPFKE